MPSWVWRTFPAFNPTLSFAYVNVLVLINKTCFEKNFRDFSLSLYIALAYRQFPMAFLEIYEVCLWSVEKHTALGKVK
jgi:hypothetical protein